MPKLEDLRISDFAGATGVISCRLRGISRMLVQYSKNNETSIVAFLCAIGALSHLPSELY